jgi:hypothetical protein
MVFLTFHFAEILTRVLTKALPDGWSKYRSEVCAVKIKFLGGG